MKNIVLAAAAILLIVVAGIVGLLYRIGKELNYYRCGCSAGKRNGCNGL